MKKLLILSALLIPHLLMAQEADTLDLGEFVVTASKISTLEKETTKPVTIIDAEEIRRSAGKSLSELLNSQNGVLINGAFSSPGKDKAVYLRGASTQYTLILIDGFPVSDPSSEGGAFDLRLIPLSNVERVEIVKGSMSTLYGSDAIAGVINIITKKPDKNLLNITTQAAYGSFNTSDLLLGANGEQGKIAYAVNLSRYHTDGISEAESSAGESFQADGMTREAVSAKFTFSPIKQISITPFLNYSDYDGEYDNGAFSDGENQYLASLLNTGSRFNVNLNEVDLKGAYTFNQAERTFIDQYGVFNPKAEIHTADAFATYNKYENARVLAGFAYQKMNFELEDNAIDEGIDLLCPYVTTYLKSGFGLNAEAGLRLNHHSAYGSNWTYNIAPVYSITDELRFLASLSSGFKAPTLNELFGPFGANIDLKPQRSRTFDIGIGFNSQRTAFSASLHYFRRSIDDLIIYSTSGYLNINKQEDYGIESSVSYAFKTAKVSAFYNYLNGAIQEDGVARDNLIRRPKHSFGLKYLQTVTENWSLDVSANFIGKRKDSFFNNTTFLNEQVELNEYLLVNLHSQYELLEEKLLLFVDIKNLLNADFYEVYGYNSPGIHFQSGIRFEF